ncbi:hypothetical protein TKK_0018291 [Trichogramma kaykai]
MKFSVRVISCLLLCAAKCCSGLSKSREIGNIRVTFNESQALNLSESVIFFTRDYRLLINDELALAKSAFNHNKPTKIVTHGWLSSSSSSVCTSIRDALGEKGDYNIILVDWHEISKLEYTVAAGLTKQVGKFVGGMINFLMSKGSSPSDFSLVGHSLGAHIMGFAGQTADHKVAHIVGLDPAAPGFSMNDADDRLSQDDASLVEIIHTNAGNLGILQAIGHIDYYPNGGGVKQPGCGPDPDDVCSHGRSHVYYAESLRRSDAWWARRCDSYVNFLFGKCDGNLIVPFASWLPDWSKPHGVYMLRTGKTAPFGLGLFGAERDGNETDSAKSYLTSSMRK